MIWQREWRSKWQFHVGVGRHWVSIHRKYAEMACDTVNMFMPKCIKANSVMCAMCVWVVRWMMIAEWRVRVWVMASVSFVISLCTQFARKMHFITCFCVYDSGQVVIFNYLIHDFYGHSSSSWSVLCLVCVYVYHWVRVLFLGLFGI